MLRIERDENDFHVSFYKIRRFNTVVSGIIEKQLLQLLNVPGTVLILDLEGIQFIDSSGFDTLLKLEKTSRAKNCVFLIKNVSPEVEELIYLVKLNEVFRYSLAGAKGVKDPAF